MTLRPARPRALASPEARCLVVWAACALLLCGCSRPPQRDLVQRLGPEGLARREIDREVRETLPPQPVQELAFEFRPDCRLEIGWANPASDGALGFAVDWLGPDGAAEPAQRVTAKAGGGWTDVRLPAPAGGAAGIRLTVEGAADRRGLWSRPRALCPARQDVRALRSVILVSLDTLRADRLGVYGNPHGLTPNLDRIARAGTRFEHAYAQFPNTLGSHAALFTGRYASRLDLGYGKPLIAGGHALADAFARRGYATAAFTENGFVSSHYGFDAGFDSYHNGPAEAEFPGDAAATFARGVRWLENLDGEPFFLFLHTYQVHTPYIPDPAVLAEVMKERGARYRGQFATGFESAWELLHSLRRVRFRPADRRQIERLYDAEVKGLDREIGTLFAELARLGLDRSALIVVLSDHGDAFFEHEQLLGHGESLYQEVLHVPLIFHLPGVIPAGERIAARVGLIDVGPTIAALAGIGPALSESSGRDRAAWLLGEPSGPSDPVFSELQWSFQACEDRQRDKTKVCPYDGVSIRDDAYTFLHIGSRDEELLYDARGDLTEKRNLAVRQPKVAERYRELADGFRKLAKPSPATGDGRSLDPATREHLRALGYLE